jgi:hypothetical protein
MRWHRPSWMTRARPDSDHGVVVDLDLSVD